MEKKIKSFNNVSLYVNTNGEVIFNGSMFDFSILILYAINDIINMKELKQFSIEARKLYLIMIEKSLKELIKEVK